jgi:GNAT superfamily N-acetyltransferase
LTAPGEERRDDRISIRRLTELPGWRGRLAELDPIFFESSLTKSFADQAARSAFHERWLGRFLARWPELAHVALSDAGPIVGYIVGAHADPARDPAFADIGVYRELAHLTPQYPAHLHINLAAAARSRGTGSRLVEAFVGDARRAGLPGVHLVTGRDSRNRSFYARNGFLCAAEITWGGTPIVMLARAT